MEFFELSYLLYIGIGIISGIASGLFGIGGGMIIVPIGLVLGLSSHMAIAMSVLQMVFASVFGSYINYKKKNLQLQDGLFVGLGGIIGASFSGLIVQFFSDIALTSIFLCVSIIFFLKYAFSVQTPNNENQFTPLVKNSILIAAGAFTGIFAISLGIGGGLLIGPILGYFLGYHSKKVVSLSLFFVIFASISGTISFYSEGIITKEVFINGVLIGLGSMLGVLLGIKIVQSLQLSSHKKAFLAIYILSISLTIIALVRKMAF